MKAKILFSLILSALFLFTSCDKSELNGYGGTGNTSSPNETVLLQNQTTTIEELTTSDEEGLLLMREEEKMAHDVYVTFAATYNRAVFSQIASSETNHTEAVLGLIEYYGLTDPASTEVGVFTNPEIQKLYDELIAAGNSVENALATGAKIEEYDIKDLKELIAATSNSDIIRVYSNLLSGSENHLRAFVSNLTAYGITYEPQILTSDEYNAIVSVSTGNYGNSTGSKGYRGGR